MKAYKMDFTAETEFVRGALYSAGGALGLPVGGITTADLPASYSQAAVGFSFERYADQVQGNRPACRGDRLMLNGSLEFSLKESGWQSSDATIAVNMDSANRKENCLARNSSQPSAGATSAPSASAPTGIASPTFANTNEKAYVAAMKSDLRNMATYEEQYAADNRGAYFSGTATAAAALQGYTPSQNVTVIVRAFAGPPTSWSGTATHTQTAKTCVMTNGVITCTAEPSTQRSRPDIPAAVPQPRNLAPSELGDALSGTYWPVPTLPRGVEDFHFLTLFIKGPKIDGNVGQRTGVGVPDRLLPIRNGRLNGKQFSFESIQQDGVRFAFAGEFVGRSNSTRLRGHLKRLSSGGVQEADVELYLQQVAD